MAQHCLSFTIQKEFTRGTTLFKGGWGGGLFNPGCGDIDLFRLNSCKIGHFY